MFMEKLKCTKKVNFEKKKSKKLENLSYWILTQSKTTVVTFGGDTVSCRKTKGEKN